MLRRRIRRRLAPSVSSGHPGASGCGRQPGDLLRVVRNHHHRTLFFCWMRRSSMTALSFRPAQDDHEQKHRRGHDHAGRGTQHEDPFGELFPETAHFTGMNPLAAAIRCLSGVNGLQLVPGQGSDGILRVGYGTDAVNGPL